MMRAKMTVSNIRTDHQNDYLDLVAKYENDNTPEDNTFAKYTPSADFHMTISNPNLRGKFHVGQQFYVDFSEIKPATQEVS